MYIYFSFALYIYADGLHVYNNNTHTQYILFLAYPLISLCFYFSLDSPHSGDVDDYDKLLKINPRVQERERKSLIQTQTYIEGGRLKSNSQFREGRHSYTDIYGHRGGEIIDVEY